MSEASDLENAQRFVTNGEKAKALPILLKLYESSNLGIRLDAGLALLVTLDHVTQNEELLTVVDKIINVTTTLKKDDIRAYLLSQKAQLLFNKLSKLTYNQHNLNLSAGVFHWIDFSLEADKKEFEEIAATREKLGAEIGTLEAKNLEAMKLSNNRYLRSRILISLGEISFSRFLDQQLDFYNGGRMKSKIANMYWVRRFHLDKILGYTRDQRRKMKESQRKSIAYFFEAIEELKAAELKSDLAYAFYNLSVKFMLLFRFRKAQKYLDEAKKIVDAENDKALIAAIDDLEKQIKDGYRHTRNYVEEFGLDLPRGLRD